MTESRVSASDLKQHCARILDGVARKRHAVVITKHGRPVARIVPFEERAPSLFGYARGCITIHGDIISPVQVTWEAGAAGNLSVLRV